MDRLPDELLIHLLQCKKIHSTMTVTFLTSFSPRTYRCRENTAHLPSLPPTHKRYQSLEKQMFRSLLQREAATPAARIWKHTLSLYCTYSCSGTCYEKGWQYLQSENIKCRCSRIFQSYTREEEGIGQLGSKLSW